MNRKKERVTLLLLLSLIFLLNFIAFIMVPKPNAMFAVVNLIRFVMVAFFVVVGIVVVAMRK